VSPYNDDDRPILGIKCRRRSNVFRTIEICSALRSSNSALFRYIIAKPLGFAVIILYRISRLRTFALYVGICTNEYLNTTVITTIRYDPRITRNNEIRRYYAGSVRVSSLSTDRRSFRDHRILNYYYYSRNDVTGRLNNRLITYRNAAGNN